MTASWRVPADNVAPGGAGPGLEKFFRSTGINLPEYEDLVADGTEVGHMLTCVVTNAQVAALCSAIFMAGRKNTPWDSAMNVADKYKDWMDVSDGEV